MSVPIEPSLMKFIPPRERFKLLKEKQAKLQETITATSSATGLMAPRTVVHYKGMEKHYQEFIDMYNEDNEQNPIMAWTKEGYNYQMVYDYITFRSIFGIGRVEKILQLGTMVREMNSINALANRKNESLKLSDKEMCSLRNYMYQLSQIGQLGRKGKEQAIFGLQEALIITKHLLERNQENHLNFLTFRLQVAMFVLLICYTGVRPASIISDAKVKDSEYLRWKHVKIWREGQDERGHQIVMQITIPHLKGRGRYFSEVNRISKKTLRSFVDQDRKYSVYLDTVLLMVALAFRRKTTIYENFEQWWNGTQSLLQIKDECKDEPVFINHTYGETSQSAPWNTDTANHTFSRIIRSAGLNGKGTLYSFRRNFAITINDNLSKETASSLMGHNPYSHILKKSYAGGFEQMDMTTLMQKGERAFAPTMSPLLKPHAYHIADIRKYNLTPVEIQEKVFLNESYTALIEKKTNYVNERNKKYGTTRRTSWEPEERKILQAMHNKVKQRKRYLTMLALKEKHEKIFNEVEEQVLASPEGVVTFDETRLLAKYGVPLVSSQEQLLAEDDDLDEEIAEEIELVENPHSSQEVQNKAKNHKNHAAFETLYEIDYEEEPEGTKEEDESQTETGLEELEEIMLSERDLTHVGDLDDDDLIFEENLMYDLETNNGVSPPVSTAEVQATTSTLRVLQQQRCRDILLFTRDQDRLYTKQKCNLCIEQDIQAPVEYPTLKQLATHLYTSQASTSWEQPTTTHRIGMHTRSAIFLREFQPISNGVTFSCGYLNCNFKNIREAVVSQHLRKHLSDEGIQDASEEEAIQTMVQYIENVVGYTLSSLEIQGIISQRKANIEKGRKRRRALKEAKEMETKDTETKKQAKKPKAKKPKAVKPKVKKTK